MSESLEGGCHCGRIRFRVELTERTAIACNCSVCSKKGFLHAIVAPERFTLLRGEGELATYSFGTHTARHHFCRTCGIHPFYRPRSHPGAYDVNVRCLDGDVEATFRIEPFDGKRWEENVETIR